MPTARERGEHERGPPVFRGVRGSPPRKFLISSASMCVFMGFMRLGPDSVTIFC